MDENEQIDNESIINAAEAAETAENETQVETEEAPTEGESSSADVDDAEDVGGGEAQTEDGGDGKPFEPDDALFERAVKAGLSLADARSFKSKDSMERILTALEATASKPKETEGEDAPADEGSGAEGDDAQSALAQIPELSEDEGYDEGLVAAFNGLRRLAIQQSETIANLVKAGESAKAKDRFSQLVDTLDESVRKGMDAPTRSHLKKQYDILAAGYKAMNTEKKDDEIFKEAATLALGDRLSEAALKSKADALAKRRNLALAKPGGEGAARKVNGSDSDDPAAQAAAEIRAELGL